MSSSSSVARWKYDVFLSFSGETRNNFTAFLHERLLEQGITKIFLDEEELQKGRPVSELFTAIEQSRLAIVVISPKYASSKWCMNELLKILKCMEKRGAVLPIFYSVEPTDVGKRLGDFGKAFTVLEQSFKDEEETVERWRAALTIVAKINGWPSKDRYEPDLIKEIVEKGTPAVEGIVLEKLESKEVQCHPEAFSKMFNLRLLKLHNVHLPKSLRCLPNSLRFLKWKGFPLNSLPLDFEPGNLVELNMCHSSIEQLWTGTKNFEKLKVIKLSHSKSLTKTPDFEGFQNLERLDLEGCESLVEIHFSVGVLKKLTFLNLKDCKSLELLPGEIEMEYLEVLVLSGCSSVKKIPNFVEPMEHLRKLSLDGTAIESIPSSIEHLTSLSSLDLRDCINLNCLPSTIGKLQSLKFLNVSGCPKLAKIATSSKRKRGMGGSAEEWPSSFGLLENLESFFFGGPKGPSQQSWFMSFLFQIFPMKSLQPMRPFLPPLSGLLSLKELDLSDGNLLEGAIPSDIGCLPSLVSLNLSGNNFRSLPTSIGQLSKLENLYLSRCKRLRHLPVLSSEVNLEVTADGCTSLELLQSPSNLDRLNSSGFNFINCFGMVEKESYDHVTCTMLQRYLKRVPYAAGDRYEIVIPGNEIPWWFPHQRMGSSVSIKLTPDWRDTKWMGYALCAVFQVFSSGWELSCVLEVNGKEEYPAPLLSTDVQPKSDHLWLFYVSRDISFGTEWQNSSCNQLIFSFKSSGSCLVKRCSARLVYEQDVEEFNQIVTQSSSNVDGEGPSGRGRLGSILASVANKFRIPHF